MFPRLIAWHSRVGVAGLEVCHWMPTLCNLLHQVI
jgi:hypothetical protein